VSEEKRKLSPMLVGAGVGAVVGLLMGKLALGVAAGAGLGLYLSSRKKRHDH
jgi:hypothetical protein